MTPVSVCKLAFWLFAVPVPAGLLFSGLLPENRRTPGVIFLCGMLVQFALFAVIAIPCMLVTVWFPFRYTYQFFLVGMAALCTAGFVVTMRRFHHNEVVVRFPEKKADTETMILWGLFAAAVIFQIVMAVTHTSFDGDDTYYVAQSLIAQQTDRMYTLLPYTGQSSRLDVRHALAVLPMWEAFVARFSGVHATVFAHTVLPVFLIPFFYLVYGLLGSALLKEKKGMLPVFLTIVCFFQVFGNVSIYTAETFFLTRTWQGKAVMAGAVVPLVFWIFTWLFEQYGGQVPSDETHARGTDALTRAQSAFPWMLLGLCGVFSGVCTSIGILLGGCLNALLTLLLALYAKQPRCILYGVLATLPDVCYLVLYVVLRSNIPFR